jgi:hypothetical protein
LITIALRAGKKQEGRGVQAIFAEFSKWVWKNVFIIISNILLNRQIPII